VSRGLTQEEADRDYAGADDIDLAEDPEDMADDNLGYWAEG